MYNCVLAKLKDDKFPVQRLHAAVENWKEGGGGGGGTGKSILQGEKPSLLEVPDEAAEYD